MAYRRRAGGVSRSTTFKEYPEEEFDHDHNNRTNSSFKLKKDKDDDDDDDDSAGSLAARATRASAAHRDSSGYGSAYASPSAAAEPPPLSLRNSQQFRSISFSKGSESSSVKDSEDPKDGFWGILARKAKSILDEEDKQFQSSTKIKSQLHDEDNQIYQSHHQSSQTGSKIDNARLRKRIDAITSSLNNLGDTLGNAFEEGRTIMEHKTADIIQETRSRTADFIQETRKLQLRRRGGTTSDTPDQATVVHNTSWQRPVLQPVQTSSLTNQETQLKASRDVAMATAAKAKVLLRELKTVKADLAFAKERCAQLEEENKRLRESREKGDNPADDDLIRLQLETLLAEKARLAHENSVYARENRFLREIVEYHQLTMQDVVYLDEGAEEVTEVYPFSIDEAKVLSSTPTSPISPSFLPKVSSLDFPEEHTKEVPKEVSDITSSLLISPSSPPKIFPNSYSPERTESSEVSTSQLVLSDGEIKVSCYGEPQIATGEAPHRPPASSP
ncbi:uncharacterized protein LOC110690747 isoform X1 [Chenopodium quinoa]|uniref:uncharacterized protein LOC110690747 isoform X1 n=1 Tax=Chenopodium quinoa TaxID=63459 RepID=UPI000B798A86|nr:uncharacterized protein LOC110690747 isoform X1 [Chenopodium quinoa]